MDKKKLVRGPMTWVLLFLLILWGTYLFFGQSASRAIDTSDGLELLAGDTVEQVVITEGLQRVDLTLTEDFITEAEDGTEENLGTEVEFFYVTPQGPEVIEAVKAADPAEGYNSVLPQTSFLASLLSFMLPLFLLNDSSKYTLPLGVQMFSSQHSVDTAQVLAFTSLSMIPALICFTIFQKKIVGGLTGAVKG